MKVLKKYAANKLETYKTGGGQATEQEYVDYEKNILSIVLQ